jgi:hypothetical protein
MVQVGSSYEGLTLMLGLVSAAVPVVNFIAVEVGGRTLSACFNPVAGVRRWASEAVIGVEVVIDMATEVGRAVKPWACADEGTAGKPFGTVVAIRCAAIGSGIVVAVRACRSDADVDVDLSL